MVINNDAVAGQWLSFVAASADHSAAAAVSAGDKDDENNKANKPSPQAGMDADGGGRHDQMTAWHRLGGSRHRPMPTPTVGGGCHQMT